MKAYSESLSCQKKNKLRYRISHQKCSVKRGVLKNFANSQENTCARVHFLIKLQVLRQGYTVKCFFQGISWNTYFTIISLCKLPRNVHDILFESFHEIGKFLKSIFRIFSIVKDFPIKFVFMLDKFFYYQWRLRKFKGKCKHKVKSKLIVVFRILEAATGGVLWKRCS